MTLAALTALAMLAGCKGGGGGSGKDPAPTPTPPASTADFVVHGDSQGPTILPTMLGVNFLYHNDASAGTWGTRALAMGARMARWPGGALTEVNETFLHHYIIDADRVFRGAEDTTSGNLRGYIAWANAHKITSTMTLPSKRYILSKGGKNDHELARREIGAFLDRLAANAYGPHRWAVFEIGNESNAGTKDPAYDKAYADFALFLEPLIRERMPYPVKVAIQDGNWDHARIRRVAAAIPADRKARFDLVSVHPYNWANEAPHQRDTMRLVNQLWPNTPLYTSEWNVFAKVPKDQPERSDYGIEQAAALIQLFDDMVLSRATHGAFWAVQQSNTTSAYPGEGKNADAPPFVAGVIFQKLAGLVGMQRLDVTTQRTGRTQVRAWRKAGEIQLLVSGNTDAAGTISVDLPFAPRGVEATRISGPLAETRIVPKEEPLVVQSQGKVLKIPVNTTGPEETIHLKLRG